jgi:hypothetical protein
MAGQRETATTEKEAVAMCSICFSLFLEIWVRSSSIVHGFAGFGVVCSSWWRFGAGQTASPACGLPGVRRCGGSVFCYILDFSSCLGFGGRRHRMVVVVIYVG